MAWNLGGWLGVQLGGSAWLAVAGILALNHHVPAALSVLVLFAVVNVYGWTLWTRRLDIAAAGAMQRLLLVLGGSSLLAVFVLDQIGIFEAIQIGGRVSARAAYVIIFAAFGALMFMFQYLADRS